MTASKIGPGIQEMLDHIVEEQGDFTLSVEDGAVIGTSKATRVKNLTQTQLLQYALVTACVQRDHLGDMVKELGERNGKLTLLVNKLLEEKVDPKGAPSKLLIQNRQQRRHGGGRLVLP
jgi:hypothetical protein